MNGSFAVGEPDEAAEDALAITALLTSPERKGPPRPCGLKSVLDAAQAFAQPDLNARLIAVEAEVGGDVELSGRRRA